MKVCTTKNEIVAVSNAAREAGKTIGFVPTMGALHEGHASLVRRSVKENEISVVSIFVNPTQFNNKEDLEKYPRNLQRDRALLESLGVDYVFAPEADEMYSADEMTETFDFDFGGLDKVMEGKQRPGHFNGVVQVVSKLFNLINPTKAYFGEKDYQQLAIIRRMVKVMNMNVQIVGCPIVRASSGLALSSRNERLAEGDIQKAINISKILFESKELAVNHTVEQVQKWVVTEINAVPNLEVEYFEIVDQTTLQPTDSFTHAVGCVTVWCSGVRLIDNMRY